MTPYVSESEHWYARDGSPAYTVPSKKGEPRPTTLRDARVHQYAPSVTKIIKCAAAPGLEQWKANQVLMAALTLPRAKDEPEAAWIKRVWEDSTEQARKAAERGTQIHAAIEKHLRGDGVDDEMWPYVAGAIRAMGMLDLSGQKPERSFTSPLGFGGKVDLYTADLVIDFKTKDGDLSDVVAYPEHWMQGAAYARGLGVPRAECANVFVSRTHPGEAKLVRHNHDDTERGWTMFRHLLAYWFTASEYRPSWAIQAVEAEVA